MATANPKRTRQDRVASISLPPGRIARGWHYLHRSDVWLRIGMGSLAALLLWLFTNGGTPPFPYRTGFIPERDIVARVAFQVPDDKRTAERREQERRETACVYKNDIRPLVELRQALKDHVFQLVRAESMQSVAPAVWNEFLAEPSEEMPDEERARLEEQWFNNFRDAWAEDEELSKFDSAVEDALAPFEKFGLLEKLEHSIEDGSHQAIRVYTGADSEFTQRIEVSSVRIAEVTGSLSNRLRDAFERAGVEKNSAASAAQLVFQWLVNQTLPTTLVLDQDATERQRLEAVRQVADVMTDYRLGDRLAPANRPLGAVEMGILRREYAQQLSERTATEYLGRSLANLGMYVALYVLCGFYIFFHERRIFREPRRLATLLGLVVVTVGTGRIAARDNWWAESVPLLLFGMTVAIVYSRELGLLLSAAVCLVITVALGQGLGEFVILLSGVCAAVLMLGRIRSRTRLIYVGMGSGGVAMLTTLGVGTLVGQCFGASPISGIWTSEGTDTWQFASGLLQGAIWFGFCSMLAGFLMTGLLPFIERLFDVQTDISLLELGDAAHPLLQELARRAPGTYNHSINVASIAEAAAESIGAHGLLVRVGAYFHDIGKMLKPGYFVENQEADENRHDSLMPAMSTLVIIAHVKDGADLARQHRLPRSIVDFIEQHHGTTLVEYFYREAEKRRADDPSQPQVEETDFRYPGPKPQTRESGVMMLADAVESASRALVDPAPARIESLVREISMQRLLDGQFDECGLTLRELNQIENSLVKSLTAVYHGRVKYPQQQQTA